jgi:hypothetical protein
LHRRLADIIEAHDPGSIDANAAMVAEHLEAAGDLRAAYSWHMRAGTWSTNRNTAAAEVSWERARQIADALPEDDPDRLTMRIAPRTLVCGNGFRTRLPIYGARFDELRELCAAAGDKASLAVGMAGLVGEHMLCGRVQEAWQLGSEHAALIESIGDPTITVGLSIAPIAIGLETGEMADVLRWSQTAIDLSGGDPTKGNFILGSPLAVAFASRGLARSALGRPGWRDDLDQAVAMAGSSDPMSHAIVISWARGLAIGYGVRLADDTALRDIDEALRIAERSVDDITLGFARLTMGIALLHRSPAECGHGVELVRQVRDMCCEQRFYQSELAAMDAWTAHGLARTGDPDGAIALLREATDDLFDAGQFAYCVAAIKLLVETLLARGDDADIREAELALNRLATAPFDDEFVLPVITLLRLRALLAQAHGDEVSYRDFATRYRKFASDFGFEGHMALAEAMT